MIAVGVQTYPETGHHFVLVNTKLLTITSGELADGEGPAVETGTESNGTLLGLHLDITKSLVKVCGDDDVHGLDDTGEILVQVFLGKLELEKCTIDLVDNDNRLDTLTKSLTEHGLSLHAHTFDGINDNESTVSNTEGSSDFRGEINVTWRINQVDQEIVFVDLLGHVLEIIGVLEFGIQGDGSGLDGHTTLLFVRASVRKPGSSCVSCRDNASTLDKGIGKGGFSVIDCGMLLEKTLLMTLQTVAIIGLLPLFEAKSSPNLSIPRVSRLRSQ